MATPLRRSALDGIGPLLRTRNDLPESTRTEVVRLLNARLADAIDLQAMCKQAHWNVRGPQFIALHKLFDKVYQGVEEYVDLIAERLAQLGGISEGTVRSVAKRTTLKEYPLTATRAEEHVAALSDALAQFGHTLREAIDQTARLEDAGTNDIFIEISRGTDQWLWFVEAHAQA
jgi:starvation-inducible DNA-binding protein